MVTLLIPVCIPFGEEGPTVTVSNPVEIPFGKEGPMVTVSDPVWIPFGEEGPIVTVSDPVGIPFGEEGSIVTLSCTVEIPFGDGDSIVSMLDLVGGDVKIDPVGEGTIGTLTGDSPTLSEVDWECVPLCGEVSNELEGESKILSVEDDACIGSG